MKFKTENINYILWLALWETFNSKNDTIANNYVPLFLDNLLNIPQI